jgi:uncharacterized membrane protein
MIEIIPNWHPIFVHFTVALGSAAVGFYFLAYLFNHVRIIPKVLPAELEIVARWCLWSAALVSIITVLAGLYAFNTVRHDAISHVAMTDHRNWALSTAGAILLVAMWSGWRYYKRRAPNLLFILALLIVQGLLLSTAWRGAELVFRYGLGVMSLPQAEEGEGHHHHQEGMMVNPTDHSNMPSMENHEQHTHKE